VPLNLALLFVAPRLIAMTTNFGVFGQFWAKKFWDKKFWAKKFWAKKFWAKKFWAKKLALF
jgi:hypothetical protein